MGKFTGKKITLGRGPMKVAFVSSEIAGQFSSYFFLSSKFLATKRASHQR
jgi:hypothetical protein